MLIESFRLEEEEDYEYEIFLILSCARAWTSGENVIAFVILQRVLATMQ